MPAVSGKINDHELKICARVAQIRNGLKLSQQHLAKLLAVNRDTVASIEYGRIPLRFDFALELATLTGYSLAWLAEGAGPKQTPLPSPDLTAKIPRKTLLSEAWKVWLKASQEGILPSPTKGVVRDLEPGADDVRDYLVEEISGMLKTLPNEFHQNFFGHISKAGRDYLAMNLAAISEAKFKSRKTLPKVVDRTSLKSNTAGMQSEIDKLIDRVKRKASKPGAKAELARTLGVAPARISEWLSGEKEPGGEYTLRLLKWVGQE